MALCASCGSNLVSGGVHRFAGQNICTDCFEREGAVLGQTVAQTPEQRAAALDRAAGIDRSVASAPAAAAAPQEETHEGRAMFCNVLGALCLLVGFWLLLNPEGPRDYGSFGDTVPPVVNLQKLYLGQTLAIVGAVFLAAGMRPRK